LLDFVHPISTTYC